MYADGGRNVANDADGEMAGKLKFTAFSGKSVGSKNTASDRLFSGMVVAQARDR